MPNLTAIAFAIGLLLGGYGGYQWQADTIADMTLAASENESEWLAESAKKRAKLQVEIDRGYTKYAAEKTKVEDKANALKDSLNRDDSALSGLLDCQTDLREASDSARLAASERAEQARKAQVDLINLASECDIDRAQQNALIRTVIGE